MIKKHFRNYGMIRPTILITTLCFLTLIMIHTDASLAKASNDTSLECDKEIAKTIVHATASGLGDVLKDVKTEDKRIALIRAFISPMRFYRDNSGYFYAYDFNGVNIVLATQKDLQGKNLYDHKDAKGKYVIRELIAAAKKGGGFVEYYWLKPGAKDEQKKLGYVEGIPGTNYFIGTGVYLP